MRKIILASTSPRRKELFERLTIPFEIVASQYEEDMSLNMSAGNLAKYLSQGKARDVARNYSNAIIISADTIVSIEKEILGKPKSPQDAKEMLKKLSGKSHSVFTGYTIIDTQTKKEISRSVETLVYFKTLDEKTINKYIESGEPMDKAGAYAIQGLGAILIEKIEGDYYNIMGLPLSSLIDSLKKFAVNI